MAKDYDFRPDADTSVNLDKLLLTQRQRFSLLRWVLYGALCLAGLLLQDTAVLQGMEPGENPVRMDYKVKKDGSLSGDLADREQLKLLESYIFRFLGKMVEDIASGNVEPNPYTRGSSHSACAFCPYGSVCHEAEVTLRRNYKTMTAQRFWDEIGKEMSGDGR